MWGWGEGRYVVVHRRDDAKSISSIIERGSSSRTILTIEHSKYPSASMYYLYNENIKK